MPNLIVYILCLSLLSCHSSKKEEVETSKTRKLEKKELTPYQLKYQSDYLMGQFTPKDHPDFVEIEEAYADRGGLFMQDRAYQSFLKMWKHAKTDGVDLVIRSATRNFDYQKGIWERKWTGQTLLSDGVNAASDIQDDVERAVKILQYSSMPGTSRHHWGTDIDLNAFNNEYFETSKGLKIYNWLLSHASDYGFAQPYSVKGPQRPHGYNEEKWHWSYLPLSSKMTQDAQFSLNDGMIKGFLGDHTPEQIGIVEKYILGIHKSCKQWH